MDYSKIPSLLLLAISIFVCLLNGTIGNMYSKKYISGIKDRFLYCMITQLFAAIMLFALVGFKIKCSAYTVVLGMCFGALTIVQSLANLGALAIGPWSYTAVINSFSTVITAFSGYLFWDESISKTKIIGIVLMVICLSLATAKDKDKKRASLKWLLFALVSSLACASIGLLQKIHQNSSYKYELSQFLIIAFISSFSISTVAYFSSNLFNKNVNIENSLKVKIFNKKILLFGMIAVGIFIALNNEFNLYLVGTMDSATFFPIVNGGGLILSVIASVLLFKEKLSKKQSIGVLLGVIATLLLCK